MKNILKPNGPMVVVDCQIASKVTSIPTQDELCVWVSAVCLLQAMAAAEVTVRIVDEDEMHQLNKTYRDKDKPTNVLSFTADIPPEIELEVPLLGDIIICAPIITKEALQQEKALKGHWAHMVIHGVLHLLGYDHESEEDAKVMEEKEVIVLEQLGFEHPYQ
jgi:probable rRNA maturation factor